MSGPGSPRINRLQTGTLSQQGSWLEHRYPTQGNVARLPVTRTFPHPVNYTFLMKKLTVHEKLSPAGTVEVEDSFYTAASKHTWHWIDGEPALLMGEEGKVRVKTLATLMAKLHGLDPEWAHTTVPGQYSKETMSGERPKGVYRKDNRYRSVHYHEGRQVATPHRTLQKAVNFRLSLNIPGTGQQ